MKVILLNGSPHADGCTYTALQETVRGLKDYGVDTEILHIGKDSIPGCKGCFACRKLGGTTSALEVLQKYPLVCEQPLVASSYWCMVHGNTPKEVRSDEEGMEIAYHLGRNMAWMVKALHHMPRPE